MDKNYFAQPVYILHWDYELLDKLEKLGYKKHPMWLRIDTRNTYLLCNRGMYGGFEFGYNEEIEDAIRCWPNEETLFLALAALRIDTDANQWFVDDFNNWEMSVEDLPSRYMQLNGHKATPEELIKKFREEH